MCNFLWKFTMFSRDFSLQHFSLVCMWTVVNRQFNWRLFYFQCKCNEFSLLFPIRQIFCWLEMSCLLCFIVYFHYQQNRKKPTSQSITPYTANAKIPCHPRNILASIGLHSKFAMVAGRTKREKCLHKMTIPINVILCMNALCAWAHTHTHGPSHEH